MKFTRKCRFPACDGKFGSREVISTLSLVGILVFCVLTFILLVALWVLLIGEVLP